MGFCIFTFIEFKFSPIYGDGENLKIHEEIDCMSGRSWNDEGLNFKSITVLRLGS